MTTEKCNCWQWGGRDKHSPACVAAQLKARAEHDRMLQEESHGASTYYARHEAKRQAEIEEAIRLRQHERLYDPFVPLPPPALPFWKKAERQWKWSCW